MDWLFFSTFPVYLSTRAFTFREQLKVQDTLALQTGAARNRTNNLPVSRSSAIPPDLQPPLVEAPLYV